MAKKKNSIALFEVIQKSKRSDASMDVPKWMDGQGSKAAPLPAAQPAQPAQPAQAAQAERPVPVPARPAPAAPQAPAPVSAPSWSERVVAVAGDRLRLSLDYKTGAIAVAALLVLLMVGFAIGRLFGGGGEPPAKQGTLAEKTPYGPHVLGGPKVEGDGQSGRPRAGVGAAPPSPSGTNNAPAVSPTGREKGKCYLVIQALAGTGPVDLEEASRIAAYCKAGGLPATVAKYTHPGSGKQRYIVWSLTPFDSANNEKAKEFARKAETLGKDYFVKYQTYDFRQRTGGGKFTPWFEVYR